MAAPRLFPVQTDIVTIVLSREDGGWRLAVREAPSGSRLLEMEPDVYEQLTLEEAGDVVDAVLAQIDAP